MPLPHTPFLGVYTIHKRLPADGASLSFALLCLVHHCLDRYLLSLSYHPSSQNTFFTSHDVRDVFAHVHNGRAAEEGENDDPPADGEKAGEERWRGQCSLHWIFISRHIGKDNISYRQFLELLAACAHFCLR
jgi:hypothetical protein